MIELLLPRFCDNVIVGAAAAAADGITTEER